MPMYFPPVSEDWVPTWPDLPAAASVVPPRVYTVLADGSQWRTDGTRWRPAAGRGRGVQRCGSVAAPLVTLTGVTAGSFALPIVPEFPAGMIAPHSRVYVEAMVRRLSAAGTALVQARLGTTGSPSDSTIYSLSTGAIAGTDIRISSMAIFGSSATSFSSPNSISENGSGASLFADRSANVDTSSAMSVTIGVASANAGDSFSLVYYNVWLEG